MKLCHFQMLSSLMKALWVKLLATIGPSKCTAFLVSARAQDHKHLYPPLHTPPARLLPPLPLSVRLPSPYQLACARAGSCVFLKQHQARNYSQVALKALLSCPCPHPRYLFLFLLNAHLNWSQKEAPWCGPGAPWPPICLQPGAWPWPAGGQPWSRPVITSQGHGPDLLVDSLEVGLSQQARGVTLTCWRTALK